MIGCESVVEVGNDRKTPMLLLQQVDRDDQETCILGDSLPSENSHNVVVIVHFRFCKHGIDIGVQKHGLLFKVLWSH